MDVSAVSRSKDQQTRSEAPSTRRRGSDDYARQVTIDDAVRNERRAQKNREAMRRQAASAFRESVEVDRAVQRDNMQAGVEKMVRTVVRKESDSVHKQPERAADKADSQSSYNRERINSAYSNDVPEARRENETHESPSNHQQKRAMESYRQDSERNAIDRTVELVI